MATTNLFTRSVFYFTISKKKSLVLFLTLSKLSSIIWTGSVLKFFFLIEAPYLYYFCITNLKFVDIRKKTSINFYFQYIKSNYFWPIKLINIRFFVYIFSIVHIFSFNYAYISLYCISFLNWAYIFHWLRVFFFDYMYIFLQLHIFFSSIVYLLVYLSLKICISFQLYVFLSNCMFFSLTMLVYLFLYLFPQIYLSLQLCISLFSTMYICFPLTMYVSISNQFFLFNSIILSSKQHLLNNVLSNLALTICLQSYIFNHSHLIKNPLKYVFIQFFLFNSIILFPK